MGTGKPAGSAHWNADGSPDGIDGAVGSSPPHAMSADDKTIGTTFVHGARPRRVSSLDPLVMRKFDLGTLAKWYETPDCHPRVHRIGIPTAPSDDSPNPAATDRGHSLPFRTDHRRRKTTAPVPQLYPIVLRREDAHITFGS